MINILLCDDDNSALRRIKKYIETIRVKLKYDVDIISYTSAKEVLHRLRSTEECSDILVTDIDMPGMSGMELVETIRREKIDIILIFITSHTEYVFDAFQYTPFRYIRKEFMEIELLPALKNACEKVMTIRDVSIVIKVKDEIIAIRTRNILYCELENRKCIIHTIQGKNYKTWKKISEIQEEMGRTSDSFLQVYRGCLVNKYYIKKIGKENIILENGIMIPISKRKKQELVDQIMNYWSDIV